MPDTWNYFFFFVFIRIAKLHIASTSSHAKIFKNLSWININVWLKDSVYLSPHWSIGHFHVLNLLWLRKEVLNYQGMNVK